MLTVIGAASTGGIIGCAEDASQVAEQAPVAPATLDKDRGQEEYAIRLRSRTLQPPPGIDPELLRELTAAISREKRAPHVIVQLWEPPKPSARSALEATGIRLLSYIDGEAWHGRLLDAKPLEFRDKQAVQRDPTLALIRWIGKLSESDKIDPMLREKGPGSWAETPDGRIKLSIEFYRDVARDEAREVLSRHGAEIESESNRRVAFHIVVDRKALTAFAREDAVKFIDLYPPPKIPFNNGSRAWTRTDGVHNQGTQGAGVVLAIWDGDEVDAAHNDLGARVTFGQVPRTNTTSEHSTHVACTMAGDGTTTANLRGHAPLAPEIITYDFDGFVPNEMEQAIDQHDFAVANNSWGRVIGWRWDAAAGAWVFLDNQDLFGNYAGNAWEYDDLVREEGRILVWAIGNDRHNPTNAALVTPAQPGDWDQGTGNNGYRTVAMPGTAKNIITVGAIDDATGNMTNFSGWGPTDDGRIKPDLVAPGVAIRSCDDDPDNGYTRMPGTSMAAPAVSGISALLVEKYREIYIGNVNSNALPLPSSVKALLVNTAQDLGNRGPDYQFGWGGVDAEAAVLAVDQHLLVEGEIGSHEEEDVYEFLVHPGQAEVRVTLAWDDIPNMRLVNYLDLIVRDPNGNVQQPWVLDPDNPATRATTGRDLINNVEQVHANAMPGLWEASVVGYKLRQDTQKYSLVSNVRFGPVDPTYKYAAKTVCGRHRDMEELSLAPGVYGTTINVFNPGDSLNRFVKAFSLTYPPGRQRPGSTTIIGHEALGPNQGLTSDCMDIRRRLPEGAVEGDVFEGFLVINSTDKLDVAAVYTSANEETGEVAAEDVDQIQASLLPKTKRCCRSEFEFVGFSSASARGSDGILKLTRMCQADYANSRVCTSEEVAATINLPDVTTGGGWVRPTAIGGRGANTGYDIITGVQDDVEELTCSGWSDRTESGLTVSSDGQFRLLGCSQAASAACCVRVCTCEE